MRFAEKVYRWVIDRVEREELILQWLKLLGTVCTDKLYTLHAFEFSQNNLRDTQADDRDRPVKHILRQDQDLI